MNSSFFLFAILSFVAAESYAEPIQTDSLSGDSNSPKVYLDCSGFWCDWDFVRTEIPYVNYVRDHLLADIHVLITRQETGSGGREYVLDFIRTVDGKDQSQYNLQFNTKNDATEEEVRKLLVRYLRAGLLPYVTKTDAFDQIVLNYQKPAVDKKAAPVDPWDYWVFSTSANSFFNGQKSSKFINGWGSLSARRITNEWKIDLNVNMNYNEERFSYTLDDGTEINTTNVRRSYYFNTMCVKSLSDHWSAAFFLWGSKDSYSNINFSTTILPGIEYNLYPYSESSRRMLRFSYGIGNVNNSYVDTTIYFKKSQNLFNHRFLIGLQSKETWGSVSMNVDMTQYLNDLNKYRAEISGDVSVRLIEGLSLSFFGRYSEIHDQLSLPKQGATVAEVLRQQRQLETSYSYFGSIGLNYTFGSIYNNIVNARFGN